VAQKLRSPWPAIVRELPVTLFQRKKERTAPTILRRSRKLQYYFSHFAILIRKLQSKSLNASAAFNYAIPALPLIKSSRIWHAWCSLTHAKMMRHAVFLIDKFGAPKSFSCGFPADVGYEFSRIPISNDSFSPANPDSNRNIFSIGRGQYPGRVTRAPASQFTHALKPLMRAHRIPRSPGRRNTCIREQRHHSFAWIP